MSKFNMQNVVIWIKNDAKGGYKFRYRDNLDIADNYLRLQVENSIKLGWPKEDIIIITNFPFEYMGVKAHIVDNICRWSAFANKMVVVNEMIQKGIIHDNFWIHDADAYQLVPFKFPEECGHVGFARHAPGRIKPQGGSAFYRKEAYDLVSVVAEMIKLFRPQKEESFFPLFYNSGGHKAVRKFEERFKKVKEKLLIARAKKLPKKIDYYQEEAIRHKQMYKMAKQHFAKYIDRFTWLNWTYNLSQQRMFGAKYPRTHKPVKVVHFHTEYPSTMNCFYYGKNAYKVPIVTDALERLFIKHNLLPADQKR